HRGSRHPTRARRRDRRPRRRRADRGGRRCGRDGADRRGPRRHDPRPPDAVGDPHGGGRDALAAGVSFPWRRCATVRSWSPASSAPIAPDGPVAYFATLPLAAILHALTAEGIPAYVSNTAGTYLCNQTLYTTLHAVRQRPDPPTVGLIHVPLLPAMVAATGLE